MGANTRLDTVDYIIMSGLVLISIAVGIYQMYKVRKTKKANDFLISSPQLGLFPIICSAIASQVASNGLIGHASETFAFGSVYMGLALAALVVIPFGTHLYLPIFYDLKTTSIYQYLEYRFNSSIRYAAAIVDTVCKVFYLSVTIYAPALALNQVSGISIWTSASVIGIVCIIYTAMGGIKAVIWADLIQLLVMVAVLLLIVIRSSNDLGGIQEVWRISKEGGRINFFPSRNSVYTPWTTVFACSFHILSMLLMNNMFMQRYLSKPKLKDVQLSFGGTCFGFALIIIFTCIIGLSMYAKYHDCDPLLNGQVASRDQTMPFFAMETLSVLSGLRGIFIAGLLCSSISSVSSILNSVTVVTIEDSIRPLKQDLSERSVMRLSKLLVLVYGFIGTGLIVLVDSVPGIMQATFSFHGTIVGPVLGVFAAGMLLPWVNSGGVIAGYTAALALTGWPTVALMLVKPVRPALPVSIAGCSSNDTTYLNVTEILTITNSSDNIVSQKTFPLYTFSPLWYVCWSFFTVLIVASLYCIIFGAEDPEKVNPNLLFPHLWKLIFKLPERIRRMIGFKMDKQQYQKCWNIDFQQEEKEMKIVQETDVPLLLSG